MGREPRRTRPFVLVISAAAILMSGSAVLYWKIPSATDVRRIAAGSDRTLLAADGQPLQTIRTDFTKRRSSWYPLKSFPPEVREIFIRAEDRRFRNHIGIDARAFARAVLAFVRGGRVQGASTITMQTSDLILSDVLTGRQRIEKGSPFHKLAQIARALALDLKWSKDDILEAYLNLVHLRGEYQGVPALSRAYFAKFPAALDASEAAVVASMIPSPNRAPALLAKRACALLDRGERGARAEACATATRAASQFHRPAGPLAEADLAPHLARRLFRQWPQEPVLTTTLDARLQDEVAAILEKNVHRLQGSDVHDSSAIVIENRSGRVLAYVGAVRESAQSQVDGIQALRQAGSTLKPFLYGKAIDNRTVTAASILSDDPTAITWSGGVYRPANYDRQFHGPVSVREALASSLNVPAVKIVTIIGLHESYALLQAIGLSQLKEPDYYGVSMALGAVETRLDELANAYRMIASDGLWTPLRFLATDTEPKTVSRRIFSKPTAYILGSVLSDPVARAIGFGSDSPLETPFWTAVKTGTSKDYRDNWCIGFSEHFTVGVWAGNFDAQAMRGVSGVSGAGPAWYEIMTTLHRSLRSHAPAPPPELVTARVRHPWTNRERHEYFLAGTEPPKPQMEPSVRRAQFVFPADGSTIVRDPHQDESRIGLFVRFKGELPEGSHVLWDGRALGSARNPFPVDAPGPGRHRLALSSREGEILDEVTFTVR